MNAGPQVSVPSAHDMHGLDYSARHARYWRRNLAVCVFGSINILKFQLRHHRLKIRDDIQPFAKPKHSNQTDAVVDHAVETTVRVLLPHVGEVVALFTGGDRGLVDEVLADPSLRPLAALRREPHLDVGDPTKAVLLETPKQSRAVDVHITEPQERS